MQTRRFCWMAVAGLALVLAAGTAYGDSILVNGGFEQPGFSGVGYQYLNNGDTRILGWTATYDGFGEQSYWTRRGYRGGDWSGARLPAEGQYSMCLALGDSLTTNFSAVQGQAYRLTLYGYCQHANYLAISVGDANVSLAPNQGVITSLPNLDDGSGRYWSLFQVDFQATQSQTGLSLINVGTDDLYYGGWLVDGLSVEPIPEPATLSLVGLGLGALVVRRKRARK